MDFEDLEATILKGFVRDRQLITIALNEGFTPELLPSPVARRLCNALIDLYLKRGAEAINEVTVRNHLESRGVLSAVIEHYRRGDILRRPPRAGRLTSSLDALRDHVRRP